MRSCSLLLLVLAGCPPSDDTGDTDDKAEFACTLGALDADDAFVAFDDQASAELVLGFQGFLFVEVHVRADAPPAEADAVVSIAVDGGTPTGATQPEVGFAAGLSDEILVFLPSSSVSAYEGRSAEIAVRMEGATRRCITTATVDLVDDDPCIHTDDEPICPDTGDTG